MLPPVSALPPHLLPSELSRQLTRSPVNFREGRRSSDGLVSPVAFQQRLYCDQETGNVGLLPLEQVCLFLCRKVSTFNSREYKYNINKIGNLLGPPNGCFSVSESMRVTYNTDRQGYY